MHPTPQAAASTLQPPDRAPADSLPACAEPGHLGHEPKSSLIPPAVASSLAAATDMVRADFGGMEGYLRDALGIDSAARERLAALYLEG